LEALVQGRYRINKGPNLDYCKLIGALSIRIQNNNSKKKTFRRSYNPKKKKKKCTFNRQK